MLSRNPGELQWRSSGRRGTVPDFTSSGVKVLLRRWLRSDPSSPVLGRRYNRAKGSRGGDHGNQHVAKDQSDTLPTAQALSGQYGVGEATVKRAGKFAEDVDSTPELKEAVEKGEPIAKAKQEIAREKSRRRNEELGNQEVSTAGGEYDVIVMDPPWPMQKITRDVRPNQADFDYPTMNEDEIKAMDIPAAPDCHIFIWTTHKFLPMALRCAEHWGFRYICTFVWHKPGGFQPIGLPQYNAEFALYCRKGTPEFVDTKAFKTCFEAGRGAHSEKPEEFYDVLRRVTSGRRLDMFNRRQIEGFEGWGNESANVA